MNSSKSEWERLEDVTGWLDIDPSQINPISKDSKEDSDDYWLCSNCNHKTYKQWLYCASCGRNKNSIPTPKAKAVADKVLKGAGIDKDGPKEDPSATWLCPDCNHEEQNRHTFCDYCGYNRMYVKPKSAFDIQEGGDHYKKYAIQPTEYCQRNNLNACESNVVKYVTRHRDKNGLEDLNKAIHYLELLKEIEYNED